METFNMRSSQQLSGLEQRRLHLLYSRLEDLTNAIEALERLDRIRARTQRACGVISERRCAANAALHRLPA